MKILLFLLGQSFRLLVELHLILQNQFILLSVLLFHLLNLFLEPQIKSFTSVLYLLDSGLNPRFITT